MERGGSKIPSTLKKSGVPNLISVITITNTRGWYSFHQVLLNSLVERRLSMTEAEERNCCETDLEMNLALLLK